MLAVNCTANDGDPLDPLWKKAQEAAERGDMPGLLYVWNALAAHGVWQIYSRIGWLYELGADGVERDMEQALHWYRKAVFEGDDPLGHVGLGRAYYNGNGVDNDYRVAFEHFQKAYQGGLPDAAVYLGIMYQSGVGVEQDVREAQRCFDFAASKDYFFAYFKLARIAFNERQFLKAAWLCLKGWYLGLSLSRRDPSDPRLLGVGR